MEYINNDLLCDFEVKYEFFTPFVDDFKYHSGILFWVGTENNRTQSMSHHQVIKNKNLRKKKSILFFVQFTKNRIFLYYSILYKFKDIITHFYYYI